LLAQVTTTTGKVAYTYNGIENLTLGLTYDPVKLDSNNEPAGTEKVDNWKDVYGGTLGYKIGKWNLQFQVGRTIEDDRTLADNDTTLTTYTFTPTWTLESLTVTPSYSYNTSWAKATEATTNTSTAGLSFSGDFFEKRFTYDLAGTRARTTTSDNSADSYTMSATYKLGYVLADSFGGFVKPTLSIDGSYTATHDYIAHTYDHDNVVYLVFSSSLPFSF
jgi:hypothetical protein